MLALNGLTKIEKSEEIRLLSGATVTAEGLAIVQTTENGLECGKLSTASGDVFLGFSYGKTMTPVTKSIVETLVVPATSTYTITLARTPISGQIFVTNGTTAQTAGTPGTTANEYSITGKVITLHSAQAGLSITVTYRYSPTALELLNQDKLNVDSVNASDMLGQIGIIKSGKVYTDQFNAGGNWVLGAAVHTIANGIIGPSGGVAIPGAFCCHIPNAEIPYVGVRF